MKITANREKIQTILTRATSEIIIDGHLRSQLESGKKLRIKLGIDPTSPDIHLGHAVSLMKLRQFQELGHQAVLIIGDFTAMIGDPTGRTEVRKPLSPEEIKKNLKNYLDQIGKIIDIKKTEIRHNNEWFGKMKAREFYDLTTKVTVQQVLKRDDFQKRIQNNQEIAVNEMMYPIFQGYDSVMVRADVELGGEDQKVNLLMGRRVQRAYGLPEQDILTTWLIEGTDGSKKMSKSFGNYVGVAEEPDAIFGKIMSIPDELIIKYFQALTNVPDPEIKQWEIDLKSQKVNPRDAKIKLSYEIVKVYYGDKAAENAEGQFERVFVQGQLPEKIPTVALKKGNYNLVELLVKISLTGSKNEAKRLINEGAVRVDDKIIKDYKEKIDIISNIVIRVGKRKFVKIEIK